ncbi:TetR/AcrR family transcriptional regulator [Nocardioides sp.]|uniref:TetR/AcrR family transcriptional regulator n=1 Tax=Nocardioides sp. TaxID=35761 RepID=UPI0019AC22C3|nr:TetR/AcrR family transcriptional regulator [Nocardioides sp.]MBC7277482.1 TetR/AcrR family transcriptional regulator [Nocardioides sp.]
MSSADDRRPRPGRPRHISGPNSSLSPRDQILDASARLFVHQGFAATSTREIAERVGIRQASIYYHFPSGKDEILGELLEKSVRPTVDKVAQIEGMCPPEAPETALYVLMLLDVRTLVSLPHNTGFLAQLPEVTRSPAYEQYDKTRRGLEDAYERLGCQVVRPGVIVPGSAGEWLLNHAETVIFMRRSGATLGRAAEAAIAASGIRMCGAGQDQIDHAGQRAAEVLASL